MAIISERDKSKNGSIISDNDEFHFVPHVYIQVNISEQP